MRQDRRTMPSQSDTDCRSAVEPVALRKTVAYGHDHYYMRRMKEILQSPVPAAISTTTYSVLSSNDVRLQQQQQRRTGENSVPQVGATIHVGPPALPVRLLDHLYMGSQRNADDVELLRRLGITHVLNCAGLRRYDFTRSPYPKEAGIKGFRMISAEDQEDFDIKSHFEEAIAFLDDVRRCHGRALVHCNLGVNRSGAVVAAYLMASERRTLLDVIQFLKSKRYVVLSNKGFRRQLIRFARERGLLDPVDDECGDKQTSERQTAADNGRPGANGFDCATSDGQSSSSNRLNATGSVRSAPVVVDGSSTAGPSSANASSGKSKPEVAALMPFNGRSSNSDLTSSVAAEEQTVCSSSRTVLSPVYETPTSSYVDDTASAAALAAAAGDSAMSASVTSLTLASSGRSSNVFGGLLTFLGGRKPFRSTSFSNVSTSCSGSTMSIGAGSGQGSSLGGGGPHAGAPSSQASGGSSGTAGSQQALSTSRPLRVYTRSSTDTELYRPGGSGARPTSATRSRVVGGRFN